jgi:hypothetical protein
MRLLRYGNGVRQNGRLFTFSAALNFIGIPPFPQKKAERMGNGGLQ